jgi:hypothetical protein
VSDAMTVSLTTGAPQFGIPVLRVACPAVLNAPAPREHDDAGIHLILLGECREFGVAVSDCNRLYIPG